MSILGRWPALVFSVCIFCIAGYFFWASKSTETIDPKPPELHPPKPAPINQEAIESQPEPSSAPAEPIPLAPEVKISLPDLNDSDSSFLGAITTRSTSASIASLLVTDEMIRKVVRAIASLSQGHVVKEYRPVQSPGGYLAAEQIESSAERKRFRISQENFSRYQNCLQFISWLSPQDAAEIYREYLPLFQQAYAELGLREASFSVVADAALNNIIEAPRIPADAVLQSPSVMYVFEENRFESRSAVSKLLWRLGDEQAEQLLEWLRAFRAALAQ